MTMARNTEQESYEQRRDRASREMGSYMLRGWTMTNEVCPIASCGCPLMRSRDQEWICVLCGPMARQTAATTAAAAVAAAALPATTTTRTVNSIASQEEADEVDLSHEIERQRALMREQERREREREQGHNEEQEEGVVVDSAEERHTTTSREQSRRDNASRLLSQKMLQGWTMLGDVCPTCEETPLVRNTAQRALCVLCEKYFQRGPTQALPWHTVLAKIQQLTEQLASANDAASIREQSGMLRELVPLLQNLERTNCNASDS
ncbi:hypothetical protein RI367_005767 [Sorochytrium milnesiophthora]